MLRRPVMIVGLFILAAILLWFFLAMRLPAGVEAKGGTQDWLPWISFAGAIVTFLTGLAGLVLKLIEIRSKLAEARQKGA